MKILMVTPELDPYVKVGGLADVAGSLSRALAALGHDVRCVCPLYRSVVRHGEWTRLPDPQTGRECRVRILPFGPLPRNDRRGAGRSKEDAGYNTSLH
jgi:hypothetical protein